MKYLVIEIGSARKVGLIDDECLLHPTNPALRMLRSLAVPVQESATVVNWARIPCIWVRQEDADRIEFLPSFVRTPPRDRKDDRFRFWAACARAV